MTDANRFDEDDLKPLISNTIENLRLKLLDLSRRNPLVSTRFSARSNSHFRVVDELPDVLSFDLGNQQSMRLIPLPALDEDPKDEQGALFQGVLANARLTDGEFQSSMDEVDASSESALEQIRNLERELKDRLRVSLDMPPHVTSGEISLIQHARNNGITPSYELPQPTEIHQDGRHTDSDIQTLLLPGDLDRKLIALMSKCKTWQQETGIHVLHAGFGFLEWSDPKNDTKSMSPLILMPIEIKKTKSSNGLEFHVRNTGEPAEVNLVLGEKMRREFGIELPSFDGGSIENYLGQVNDASPKSLPWKVLRQVAFGVFPSARMAMYHDLDTSKYTFHNNKALCQLFGGADRSGGSHFADEYEVDQPAIENKVPCLVLDADSSQFSTLVDLADGKNIAVEGPPGSGKSQTIVNAIAAALVDGKKVLFVAEKQAALNVVKSRLEAIGLGEFVLPLQAQQSSRALIIQSIRDRIELEPSGRHSDYGHKLEAFRKTRSEISRYIDILTAKHGQTGLTVFEILGNTIATREILDDKPRELQTSRISEASTFDAGYIEQLQVLSRDIATAWDKAENALPFWKQTQLCNVDRFLVEHICEEAVAASRAFDKLGKLHEQLFEVGLKVDTNQQDLTIIGDCLGSLVHLESDLDIRLVRSLCEQDRLSELKIFLDQCENYRQQAGKLLDVFFDHSNVDLGNRLRSLEIHCKAHKFETLNVYALLDGQRANSARQTYRLRIIRALEPIVKFLPDGGKCALIQIAAAHDLVNLTGIAALSLRSEILSDPMASNLLATSLITGEKLNRERTELEKLFSLSLIGSSDDIAGLIAVFRSAGSLRFLSPGFRSARRSYCQMSLRETFVIEEAVADLRMLLDWNLSQIKFSQDPQNASLFGINFRGLDTDFELYSRLMNFYNLLDVRLPGVINRNFRQFLKSCDIDLLQSFPKIEVWLQDNSIQDLMNSARDIQSNQSELDKAIGDLGTMIAIFKNPDQVEVSSLSEYARLIDALLADQIRLDRSEIEQCLGDRFKGVNTIGSEFSNEVSAVGLIVDLPCKFGVIISILESRSAAECSALIAQVASQGEIAGVLLEKLCELARIDRGNMTDAASAAQISTNLLAASRDEAGLHDHSKYAAVSEDFDKSELSWVKTALLNAGFPLTDLDLIIVAVIHLAMARQVFDQYGAKLSSFNGEKLNGLRKRLASLDREIIRMARTHVKAKICQSSNPAEGVGRGKKSLWTEMALIRNEINKKKAHISVRNLTSRAGRALLELKPCWMMSPLAVAQYLQKHDQSFDLCIIDEASQMPPENSIGAIARSGQIMVVGDTNQLPPSSFFRKMLDDEDIDEDEKVVEESILEAANAAFHPKRRLRWHYRSRHSALINFSSHMVYDNKLIIFPSANDTNSTRGVSLIRVEGNYHAGTNSDEATAMVDAAINFMHTRPNQSLGLVTLNQKQRELISEKMDFAIAEDQIASNYIDYWADEADGLEAFFIKNLENVQGDERDVIFIGTVYGPEKPGAPVMQRFGPINGLAGRRRLNVLFSRAKEQMVTFSSMTAADIKADEHGNAGAYMLKKWLEYSVTGILPASEHSDLEPGSVFEGYVIEQIVAMGCEAVPQIGVKGYRIDIGVKHPDWPHGFIMAVECDGATYHSSKSARERDRLRQEVLEGLGWHFHRIWSTDWFNDARRETDILKSAIDARFENLQNGLASSTSKVQGISEVTKSSGHVTDPEDIDQEFALISAPPMPETSSAILTETKRQNHYISVGDRVLVKFLTGDTTGLEITLSDTEDLPDEGIIHIEKPLGSVLLDAEEGDTVELLIGSYRHQALIEKVFKGNAAPNYGSGTISD